MYRITFCLGDLSEPDVARAQLLTLLWGMVGTDALYLKTHPGTPSVASFTSSRNARYVAEPEGVQSPGQEAWRDVPMILRPRRDGLVTASDRDVACWRCAELLVSGVPATLALQMRPAGHSVHQSVGHSVGHSDRPIGRSPDGLIEYRPVVVRPDGFVEDPSGGRGWRPYQIRQRTTVVLDLFNGERERELSHATLNVLLKTLTDVNVIYLRKHPEVPRVHQAPVRYLEEPPGAEEWQDAVTCLQMGDADCEDLSCWRSAELQVRDEIDAVTFFDCAKRKDGSYLYHILTRLPDGRVEDLSRFHGMR